MRSFQEDKIYSQNAASLLNFTYSERGFRSLHQIFGWFYMPIHSYKHFSSSLLKILIVLWCGHSSTFNGMPHPDENWFSIGENMKLTESISLWLYIVHGLSKTKIYGHLYQILLWKMGRTKLCMILNTHCLKVRHINMSNTLTYLINGEAWNN